MKTGRLFLLLACVAGCAGPVVRPSVAPLALNREALLVLPGFGYSRREGEAFRSVAAASARAGLDVYVAGYLTRSGLGTSRARLEQFIREHRLERYERLHVFAFIAGGWALNPLVEAGRLPNLTSVIYDRSPFQERAPRIASEQLHFLTWLRFGSTVFDVARTPYRPITAAHLKVALMVESRPTAFVRRYAAEARHSGPFAFGCDSFLQRYDDCLYLAMDHDDLYVRFEEVWPEVVAFIRTGHFSVAADRTIPSGDPLAGRGR